MPFKNHRHSEHAFLRSAHVGGKIDPTLVVVHDTASRIEAHAARDYLRDNAPGVSAHFTIERDGEVTQLVPLNRAAAHAGRSSYHGRDWVNRFSIGIELVSPGRMERSDDAERARAWWGEHFEIADYSIVERTTPEHGTGLWMPYTTEQLAACEALLHEIVAYRPGIEDIVPHWYVSPGRKIDTGPLFPLAQIKARVLGRDDPLGADLEARSDPALMWVTTQTPGDGLNMRRWPSFNPNVVNVIPHGTRVPVERTGVFDHRPWLRVRYGGVEGWVVASYTDFGDQA
ncbi:MAG: N-acetylmuramoyl-L-alanine amidase [Shimia sp.]